MAGIAPHKRGWAAAAISRLGRQRLCARQPQAGRGGDADNSLVRPLGIGEEMVQRLVRRLHPVRRHPGGHRLHALALARQDEPGTIGFEWWLPVNFTERRRQGPIRSLRSIAPLAEEVDLQGQRGFLDVEE
jgi:hypothetical protein